MNIDLFSSLTDNERAQLYSCVNAQTHEYEKDEAFPLYGDTDKLYIVQSGSLNMVSYDIDGKRTILEHLTQNSVFSDMPTVVYADNISVLFEKKSQLLVLDSKKLIKPCEKCCPFHTHILTKYCKILQKKNSSLMQKIVFISQRSIRKKLLQYFQYVSHSYCKQKTFIIPYSMNNLADYLCIDRSAMLREMKQMRNDGILESSGRKITLK